MKPTGCDRPGARPLRSPCSEQGKLPAAEEFRLAERDKTMSEPKLTYMQQLDAWTEATVINPLHEAITDGDGADCDATCEAVKKAIREKVLESYKNGLKAPSRPVPAGARKETKHAQAQAR
jgi:hypothetical protein